MIDFQTFRLLNETLGFSALGVKSPQNLGIGARTNGFGEAGMPPELGAGIGGTPGPDMGGMGQPGGEEGHDDQGMPGEEGKEGEDKDPADMSHEELVAALVELGHEQEELDGMEDDELRDMLTQAQGDEDGEEGAGEDDADLDADHDDDMGNAGAGGHDDMMPNKKPESPFMKAFMKKEAAEFEKGEKEKKSDEKPTFMMKKKCGSGMEEKKMKCKSCKDNMKKENRSEYARPKDYDPSEDAFFKSIREQLASANVNQKFVDGMKDFKKEDLLIQPNPLEAPVAPKAGEAGYAPQGRIGADFTAEAVADMMKRIEKLEKK